MQFNPYSEIKLAEKSFTVNEQKEHISEIKNTVAYFIQNEKAVPHLQEVYDRLVQIEKTLASEKDPIQISPELIEQMKTLSNHPIVRRSIHNRPSILKNSRTLFDYTD